MYDRFENGNGFDPSENKNIDFNNDNPDNREYQGNEYSRNTNYNDSFTGGYQGNSPGENFRKEKQKRNGNTVSFVSKKVFIVTIILCLILSSALTLGMAVYLDSRAPKGGSKKVSATNYDLAKATGSKLSVQEVVAKNEDAVVEIRTESISHDSWIANYVTEGAGSGVIIDSDGYIITCNHVISGASSIKVTTRDGTEYNASVVGADPATDVAVIKIKGKKFPAATYGKSSDLTIGDMVIAIGNPLGQLGGSASAGIISSEDRAIEIGGRKMNLLQTDASINPGNSGGGLFDGSGHLIGIVVAKSTGSDIEGLGFAIPSDKASAIAKDLIENGKVKDRCAIGIKIVEIPDAQSAMENNVKMTGVYVAETVSKEAKKAGFEKGDYIYYMGDKKIESSSDLFDELAKHKPGDKVNFTVVRDNKTIKIDVVLQEAS